MAKLPYKVGCIDCWYWARGNTILLRDLACIIVGICDTADGKEIRDDSRLRVPDSSEIIARAVKSLVGGGVAKVYANGDIKILWKKLGERYKLVHQEFPNDH